MRWDALTDTDAGALPGLSLRQVAAVPGRIRTIAAPEFHGMVFHEVMAKSLLNSVSHGAKMPFEWSINPYRGCSHACVYCYARGSHRYLDMDVGNDFDSQIVVKVNAEEVLRRELSAPTWNHERVALGTNTDPYQRTEGRYQLMPGIIAALAESRTSFSILTKGTLLRRDLAQLAEAKQRVQIGLSMSIAVGESKLQKLVEPGTPSARARLETVAAAVEAGFDVTVFMMPILPYLSDSVRDLLPLLRGIKEAGAKSAVYSPLFLRSHMKPWFMQWLVANYPDVVDKYLDLYPGRASRANAAYRKALASRIKPIIVGLGLRDDGSFGYKKRGKDVVAGLAMPPSPFVEQTLPAEQPMLF